MTRVSLEEGTFLTIGLHMRIDLFTCQNNKVNIYEGKVKKQKLKMLTSRSQGCRNVRMVMARVMSCPASAGQIAPA